MRRIVYLVVAALFSAIPAIAQEATVFGESVEVRIATTDVIVTKNGRPVEGLKPSDFELLVGGKTRTIVGFDEIRGSRAISIEGESAVSTPSEEPLRRPRYIILFFDVYSLDNDRRNQALASIRRLLDGMWREGDQVMLATWNNRLRIPQPLTTSREELDRHLDDLTTHGGAGFRQTQRILHSRIFEALSAAENSRDKNLEIQRAYEASLAWASAYADEQVGIMTELSQDLESLIRGVSGIDGRKVLVFVGENFPQYPGLGMYQYVNDIFQRWAYNGTIRLVMPRRMVQHRSRTHLTTKIARAANAGNVTLHTLFTGEALSRAPAESEHLTPYAESADFNNSAATVAELSYDTGGVALAGSRNFELAADAIAQDLASYYTLAWKPDMTDNDQPVSIRTKDRSLNVRARRRYVGKSLEQEIDDRVVSNLFQAKAADSRMMQLTIGKAVKAGWRKIKVPVEIVFPSHMVTLIPQDGKNVGGFDVVVASSNSDNKVSNVSRQHTNVAWGDGQVPNVITYKLEVVMRDQPGAISVGVVDALSRSTLYKRAPVQR